MSCSPTRKTCILRAIESFSAQPMRLFGGEDAVQTDAKIPDGGTVVAKVKKSRKASKTRSLRAGLQFPVGRIARY